MRKRALTKVPRFLLDVVSRAAPEAACGAEPKASTERVRMTGAAAPLTPQEAISLSLGVGQGLRPPCLPRSQSGKFGHGMQPKGLPKRSAELQYWCSNIPIVWVSDEASVSSSALLWRTSVRLVVLQGSFSKE